MKSNKLLFNMIIVIFLSAFFSGCGTSGDASSGGGDAAGVAALQGTWKSTCTNLGSTSDYVTEVFSGTNLTKTSYTFSSNNTCSGTASSTTVNNGSGTFTVVSADATVSSAWDVNITATSSGSVSYDLIYVSGSTLEEGQSTGTLNESSAADRPISVDSSYPYTLQ